MKQTTTLTILTILLLFLTGCSVFSSSNRTFHDYQTGTQGITATYVTNQPPRELTAGEPFDIAVDIKNEGTATVQEGIYTIGVEDTLVELKDPPQGQLGTLYGKSTDYPYGDEKQIRIRAKTRALDTQIETTPTTITTNICYNYQTTSTHTLCIDTDVTNKETKKTCTMRDLSISGGQGAPIAITNIQPKVRTADNPDNIHISFTITLKNYGNGRLITTNKLNEACTSQSITRDSFDKAHITMYLGEDQLDCTTNNNIIALTDGKATFTCDLPQPMSKRKGAFPTQVTFNIGYAYQFTTSTTLKVQKQQ